MNRSTILSAVLFLSLLYSHDAPLNAQQSGSNQVPAFRSGVELVTVEVGVLDKDGLPVRDLKPGDFTVTVDGQPRRVVTAEFIDAGSQPRPGAVADATPVSTNEGSGVGRLVVFVVDSNTLEPGEGRHIAADASRLLARLTFSDRSALLPLPIGRTIGFTWAHDRVRQELLRVATTGGALATNWEYGSLSEAREIATRGAFALREVSTRECSTMFGSRSGFGGGTSSPSSGSSGQSAPSSGGSQGESGSGSGSGSGSPGASGGGSPSGGSGASGSGFSDDRCSREIQSQAEMAWSMARATSLSSITALRQVIATLRRVPGDKNLVLISGGWPLDDLDETSLIKPLAEEAAAARVTVFTVFVPRAVASASRRTIGMNSRSDLNLYLWPVENLARMTDGRSFRADAGAQGIFDRLARELSGYYRIGVERNATDATAAGRPMSVKVARTGMTVRARDFFDVTTYEDRDWSARLASALDAPVPATALGLRLTSYLAADPDDPSSVRLLLSGDVSRLQPGEATLQVVVRDLEGRRVVAGEQRLGEVTSSTTSFATNVRVPAGSYVVRLAIQDGAGRVGSVDHRVEARPLSFGTLSVTGPILLQVSPTAHNEPRLPLDDVRADDRLAIEIDLQGDSKQLANADVTFEIAANPDGPALIAKPATLTSGGSERSLVAQALTDVRLLPPGQYLVRAKVSSGDEPLGELRRGFTVLESPAAAVATTGATTTVTSGATLSSAPIRGRAVATVPRFALTHVLSPNVVDAYLDKVEARPDAAFPGVEDLLNKARSSGIAGLQVSDAQAAQTPIAAFLQGLALLAQKQLNPAAAAFRAAMRASPDFFPAMVYLGACYAAAGNDKEAAAVWRTALIREGEAPTVHLLLTDALLRQGSGEIALQVVDAARRHWPEDNELKRRFVLASLMAGDVTAGLQTLEDLIEHRADDEPTLALAIYLLYDSLSHGRAIESLAQDRSRMVRLADAYRARGGPSLALVETWAAAVAKPAR